jgi:hypothetical protein
MKWPAAPAADLALESLSCQKSNWAKKIRRPTLGDNAQKNKLRVVKLQPKASMTGLKICTQQHAVQQSKKEA